MIERIQNYFIGAYEELKKVIWPSKKVVISHTIMVIVSIAVAMAFVVLLDLAFSTIIQRLINGA